MLLLLSQLLSQEQQPRVLIDALLKVERRSAASIAREAEVQPANLSRLRTEVGEGKVSEDGQSRLLKALGWSNGTADPDRVHAWTIRDADGARAVEWLLSGRLGGKAQLRQVSVEGEDSGLAGQRAWIGRLTESGGCCTISIVGSEPPGKHFPKGLAHCSKELVPSEISKNAYYFITQGKIGEVALRGIIYGEELKTPSTDAAELYNQLVRIGLSGHAHLQLLERWLREQAQNDPTALEGKLAKLDKLTLKGKTLFPKAMTLKQRQKLVSNLRGVDVFPHV